MSSLIEEEFFAKKKSFLNIIMGAIGGTSGFKIYIMMPNRKSIKREK